jgi:VanZ family protein
LDVVTAVEVVLWIVFAVFALRGARWAYAIFVILGLVWIPARTHFHLHAPPCDGDLSLGMVLNALRKYKHVTLFGIFFLMTAAQLPKTRSALAWAALATLAMGVLIELEEGATGTGYCHLSDLLPDAAGALLGAAILTAKRALTAGPVEA